MKKILLSMCLILSGLCVSVGAQMNKSEYARKAAEKLVKGDRAGAIAILDKAIEQRKDLNELYAMRAHLRQSVGDLDGALADLNEAIKITPNNPSLYDHRAMLRSFKRDHAGALQDYDAAIANGFKTEKMYLGRARIRHDLGDVEGAITDYQSALTINPMLASAHIGLAFTYERRGEVDAAITLLQDFLDRYEGKRDGKLPRVRGATPTGTSISVEREGKEKDGAQVFMESQESVATFKADTAEELDRQQANYEQAMNLSMAYASLGRLYAGRNAWDKALENYEKGLRIKKGDPYLHKLRSEVRIQRGDMQGAIDDLTIVVNARSGGPITNLDKGLLLLLQGQEAEAEKEFALHLQKYPNGKEYVTKSVEAAKKLRAQQTQQ
jgi:tetratricopeptide (TPR) repeat protein